MTIESAPGPYLAIKLDLWAHCHILSCFNISCCGFIMTWAVVSYALEDLQWPLSSVNVVNFEVPVWHEWYYESFLHFCCYRIDNSFSGLVCHVYCTNIEARLGIRKRVPKFASIGKKIVHSHHSHHILF